MVESVPFAYGSCICHLVVVVSVNVSPLPEMALLSDNLQSSLTPSLRSHTNATSPEAVPDHTSTLALHGSLM